MPNEKRLVTIPELLYTLLTLAGIKCKEYPELLVWKSQLGVERKISIQSMDQFIKNFGVGVYQIFVMNPEISGIDVATFRIQSLSITLAYEGEGKWSDPEIQTFEEEVPPEYTDNFGTMAVERGLKIASKVKDAFVVLSMLSDAFDIHPFGT